MSQTTTMLQTAGQCEETLKHLRGASHPGAVELTNVKDFLQCLQSSQISEKIADVTWLLEGALATVLHLSQRVKRFLWTHLLCTIESTLFYLFLCSLLVQVGACVLYFLYMVPLWWGSFLFMGLAIQMWIFSKGFSLPCTVRHQRLKKEVTRTDLWQGTT